MSRATSSARPYHHGDLRRALLDELAATIAEVGVAGVSIREIARRAGVSHTAAAHHFGDKSGLLRALATEGHERLADALDAARPDGFLEVGVAYVRFAVEHPAHFAVMFQGEWLHDPDEPLQRARARGAAILYGDSDGTTQGMAAWALVHGLASLVLAGAVPPALPRDATALTRAVAVHLGPGLAPPSRRGRKRTT